MMTEDRVNHASAGAAPSSQLSTGRRATTGQPQAQDGVIGEPENPARQTDITALRKRWGLHTPDTLRVRAQELGGSDYLIKGLLPRRSVAILLGDSGLGKSPLMYQGGLCVATGMSFLGCETRKGRVVLCDFENGIADIHELVERISTHLGLSKPPDDFYVWTLNDCLPRYGQPGNNLMNMLKDLRPDLAIVDSLGSYRPEAEEKNSTATLLLQEFRCLARECGTTTWGVHHRRKQSRKADESAGPLERANLRQWFQDARGASSLINNADIRLGVDEPDLSAAAKDDVALVLRGFGRVRGEIGPLYLARTIDEAGEPLGYRVLIGPELLMNNEQEAAFRLLPARFSFAEAKNVYKRSDQPTRNWLLRCISLRIVQQLGRGSYEKAQSDGASGEGT
jgi:hypothetical protein